MIQLRAVPLTLEMPPPPPKGIHRAEQDYTIPGPQVSGQKVCGADWSPCVTRRKTPVAHCRLYQSGCEAVSQLGSPFSKLHTCLVKVMCKWSVLMEAYWLTDTVSPPGEAKQDDFCPSDNDCNESAKHWCTPSISSALSIAFFPANRFSDVFHPKASPAAHADLQFSFGFLWRNGENVLCLSGQSVSPKN